MQVWIDHAQERLTRLDAHFIKDVDFGWGIIGRCWTKGEPSISEQADIGGHDWEATALKVKLTGKALMVKSLSIQLKQEASHFSQVPPGVDYRKAIQLLENSRRRTLRGGCGRIPKARGPRRYSEPKLKP